MPRSRLSVVTLGLITLMVLVFVWQLTLDGHKNRGGRYQGISQRDLKSEEFGTKPFQLTHFGGTCGLAADAPGEPPAAECSEPASAVDLPLIEDSDGEPPGQAPWPLSILLGMFMHGGIWALLFSALFLWIFGPGVEVVMGRLGFLVFYVTAGVVAAFGQGALDPDSAVPVIGAAGAVGGVIGAYLVLYPRARIVALVLIPLTMTAVEILGLWVASAWAGFQFLPGVGGVATPDTLGAQVVYLAPFAGMAFGALVAALLASRIRDPDAAALAY